MKTKVEVSNDEGSGVEFGGEEREVEESSWLGRR